MTTSGTVSATTFDTRKVIDHALRRCRIPTAQITPEMQEIARDNLYLLLSALANRGLLLWTEQKMILPLVTGQIQLAMPNGTIDVLNSTLRNLTRLTGTYATSAGGTVSLAFDDDYDTACTQVSTNGNISIELETATLLTSWGILPNGDLTTALALDRSDDGVTWTTIASYASDTYEDGVWYWFDIDPAPTALFYRLRATGGGTLDLRELYFGNTPNEVPMYRMNRDDYVNLPNKMFQSRPVQFWFDRRRGAPSDSAADQPTMWLWPAVSSQYREYQVVITRARYIEDVGTLRQTLDIPQRWYEAVVWMLAWRMAAELPEVDKALIPTLKAMNDEQTGFVEAEERDASPIKISADISPYTM